MKQVVLNAAHIKDDNGVEHEFNMVVGDRNLSEITESLGRLTENFNGIVSDVSELSESNVKILKRLDDLEKGGSGGVGTAEVDENGNLTFTGKTVESIIIDEDGDFRIGGVA